MATKSKPKRIKNPNPPAETPEPIRERIKAGAPGSAVALPPGSGPLEADTPTSSSSSTKGSADK